MLAEVTCRVVLWLWRVYATSSLELGTKVQETDCAHSLRIIAEAFGARFASASRCSAPAIAMFSTHQDLKL